MISTKEKKMGLKDWLIKRLEADLIGGHINLEELSEDERNECFKKFGEGDENLTDFLKTAYNCGAPSMYCCSGHGRKSAYVILKVTDENIELLRKVGRVLSKNRIVTNFQNHYIYGPRVTYNSKDSASTEWLDLATRIMENPELYDDSNPSIYYHERIYPSYKPFGYDLKKKLLTYLRGDKKELPAGDELPENRRDFEWVLNDEEKQKQTVKEKEHSTEQDKQPSKDRSDTGR